MGNSMQDILLGHLHKAADRLQRISQYSNIPTKASVDVLIALNYILDSIDTLSTADESDCRQTSIY